MEHSLKSVEGQLCDHNVPQYRRTTKGEGAPDLIAKAMFAQAVRIVMTDFVFLVFYHSTAECNTTLYNKCSTL